MHGAGLAVAGLGCGAEAFGGTGFGSDAAQTQAKMVIQAAKDSPPGDAIPVVVRAAASIRGEVIEADEPVGVVISK